MSHVAKDTLLLLAPFVALAGAAVVNATGPETCSTYRDITFAGNPVLVETCAGRLGFVLREPRIVHRF